VTTTVEEPKPAASLTPASVKRGAALFDAPLVPPPDLAPRAEDERPRTAGLKVRTAGLKLKGALIFGAIYVGALLFFAAAFDVWSVVLD
jgi:hypothetical protein